MSIESNRDHCIETLNKKFNSIYEFSFEDSLSSIALNITGVIITTYKPLADLLGLNDYGRKIAVLGITLFGMVYLILSRRNNVKKQYLETILKFLKENNGMGSFGELTGCEPATFGFRNDNNAKDSDITNGELNSFLTKKLFFKARRAQRELKSE